MVVLFPSVTLAAMGTLWTSLSVYRSRQDRYQWSMPNLRG